MLWLDYGRARQIFRSAKKLGVRKMWVGSDGWSARGSVTENYEDVANGAVTVQPLAAHVNGFDQYFMR